MSLWRSPARPSALAGLVLCLFALFTPIHASVSAQTAATAPTGATTQSAAPQTATAPQAAEKPKAAGNGASASGKAEAILVAEVVLLMLVGRLLGEGMQRIGQPALMGQLLAGIVLGPTVFGLLWPEAQKFIFPADPAQKGMIDGVSQIGILLLLLLTGMETDLKLVRKSGWAAIAISLSGIALPFACGFVLGQYLPASLIAGGNRLVPSLFLGTALSISSIKIVAMVVREMNFMRRDLGQIIVATAIMEDTVGWVIIAITFGIAGAGGGSGGRIDLAGLGGTVAGVLLFLLFCFTAGRWLVFSAIRWVNDNFRSEFPVITAILVIMGVSALITQFLGVRTVLGAFMAGLLIGESPILTDHIQQQLRGMISAFFMPVFFGLSGLSANLTILGDPQLAILTLGLVLIASIGKFSGAFVGSMLGRLSGREGIALGCAMNARGSTEVIVASIGLSMGALTQHLYTMIVTMAVITTMAMPPMLRTALRRIPVRKDEEIRLTREAIDEKGFVSNLERLLLTVDESPVGRMAASLAGLLAGGQGMPITIVKLDPDAAPQEAPAREEKMESGAERPRAETDHRPRPKDAGVKEMTGARSITESAAEKAADPLAKAVKRGAKASAAKVIADEAEPDPRKVHLTTRIPADRPADLVKDEARKGYDLLFLGLEKSRDAQGKFSGQVTEIVAGFDGPIALLSQIDGAEPPVLTARSRILVPVNGSPTSRRAAEVAFTLARGTGAKVTALFVTRDVSGIKTLKSQEGVLKDIARLGERYDAEVRTIISRRAAAAEAVLKEGRTRHSMIVMGVTPRPGEELFFGDTATQVLKSWKNPILLVAS